MNDAQALQLYRSNQLELSVWAASPVELVVMLYDGAIQAATRASLLDDDPPARALQIQRATAIVGELSATLDGTQGDIAQNLAAIYSFVRQQLIRAGQGGSKETLEDATRFLAELRGAWSELAQRDRRQERASGLRGGQVRLVSLG